MHRHTVHILCSSKNESRGKLQLRLHLVLAEPAKGPLHLLAVGLSLEILDTADEGILRRSRAQTHTHTHPHTHTHTRTHTHTHTHGRDVTQDTCYLGQLDVCESIKLCRAVLVSSGHVLTNELDPCGTTCLELPLNLLRGLYGPRSSLRPAHATDGCFCTTFLPKRIAVEALRCGLHWYRQAKIT